MIKNDGFIYDVNYEFWINDQINLKDWHNFNFLDNLKINNEKVT